MDMMPRNDFSSLTQVGESKPTKPEPKKESV